MIALSRRSARCGWPTLPSSSSAVTWCGAATAGGSRSPAARTKTGEPIELPFPEELVPALESYLATWRPRLARAEYLRRHPRLVADPAGHDDQRQPRLQHHHRPYPRGLRPGRSTRICSAMPPPPPSPSTAPNRCGMAARLLGHRSFATTERYYNLARAAEAATRLAPPAREHRRGGLKGQHPYRLLPSTDMAVRKMPGSAKGDPKAVSRL